MQGIWQKNMDLVNEKWSANVANFLYQVSRIYVSADLTDNVNAYVRFLNDRVWGDGSLDGLTVKDASGSVYVPVYPYTLEADPTTTPSGSISSGSFDSNVEIDLAYITLAEMFGYPISLTIGRQELTYGEGFLVGDGVSDIYTLIDGELVYAAGKIDKDKTDINTLAYIYGPKKAFDAIKFSGKYDNSTIDVIKAKLTEGYGRGTDENLYGVNWNLATDSYGVWDFAAFIKSQDDIKVKGKDQTLALSVRGEGDIPQITVGKLHVKAEVVKETGKVEGGKPNNDEATLEAWGGYFGAKYTFDNPYEPYISVNYTRLTGDKSNTKKIEAFDPMYTSESYGEIADAVLYGGSATNAKITQVGLGVSPNEKLNIGLDYYIYEADQAATSLYYVKGKADSRKLGSEWDLALTYDYTEDVQFGLTYAVFTPGRGITKALDSLDINDAQAKALIGSVKVTF
ncbi:MAG: alginate export family protein [Caldiserica bacterium]|nr:alginate export family protein [Caldisericota bacterium]